MGKANGPCLLNSTNQPEAFIFQSDCVPPIPCLEPVCQMLGSGVKAAKTYLILTQFENWNHKSKEEITLLPLLLTLMAISYDR